MMSKFIVLHFPIEGEVSFNVEDILCFFTRDDDTIIRAKDGNCYAVTESYDELKAIIEYLERSDMERLKEALRKTRGEI